MTDPVKARILFKDFEALQFGISEIVNVPERVTDDPTDPLFVLLDEGFEREAIMETGEALIDRLGEDYLVEPLSPLEVAILRACIEHSGWVDAYTKQGGIGSSTAKDCRNTLRALATKLEPFGVIINFIPS